MLNKTKMVRRICPLCSSGDESSVFAEENFNGALLGEYAFASRKLPELMHYRLIVCPRCDLLYANPIPSLQSLSKAYHEAAFDSAEEARHAARTYGRYLSGFKNFFPSTQGALDIGTGDGAFLLELMNQGFSHVVGVEPSLAPIQAASEKVRRLIRRGLFKAGNFKKNSMALVTCFQTFEHLMDPIEMCRGAHQILKKGGAFFAICHNRRSFSAKIFGLKSPIFDIEHLQLFSPESAKFMMEKAGFTRVKVEPIFNSYPLHYWFKLLPLPKGVKLALIRWLKAIKIGYLPVPLPAGNMAVVGYKK